MRVPLLAASRIKFLGISKVNSRTFESVSGLPLVERRAARFIITSYLLASDVTLSLNEEIVKHLIPTGGTTGLSSTNPVTS